MALYNAQQEKPRQAPVDSINDVATSMLAGHQNAMFALGYPCKNYYSGSSYCAFCQGLNGDDGSQNQVNSLSYA